MPGSLVSGDGLDRRRAFEEGPGARAASQSIHAQREHGGVLGKDGGGNSGQQHMKFKT
jgi:hypothetical protein